MKNIFIVLLILFFVPAISSAQGGVLKKLKDKVKDRVDQRADEGMEKGLDKVEGKRKLLDRQLKPAPAKPKRLLQAQS
jgi:coenzyme F420-reducing hydrogenase alpha subunit